MISLHMLDTDIASVIIKQRSASATVKMKAIPLDRICVSVVTRAELMFGLRRLPPDHRLHVVVRRFLAIVNVLTWGEAAADFYADIRHRLQTSGSLIGELDMMIAAHALAAGAVLVTANTRHFERIGPALTLVDWVD